MKLLALRLENFRQHVEQGQVWEDTFPLRGADGKYRWFLSRAMPIHDEQEQVVRWFGTNTDVTAQREAEAEREQLLAKQRRIAETLQRSLLQAPPPDAFPGITVKALYQSASDDSLVGGDFYDMFRVADDRVALVVGDVTGKGLVAATYTAEVKFALRAFLRENHDPTTALSRLNQFIRDAVRYDSAYLGAAYVVAAVAVVNTRTGEVVCSTAGMEPPFLLHVATGDVVELEAGGPLLGAAKGATYQAQREQMNQSDLLVMGTDGITEARYGGVFFGYDGLVRAVKDVAHLDSVADIGQTVANQARAFAGGVQRDDVCLLLARRVEGAGGINPRSPAMITFRPCGSGASARLMGRGLHV